MSNQDFDAVLKHQLDDLDKEVKPQRDLWQGIELALANEPAPNDIYDEQPSRMNGTRLFAIAATFAFVGMFSWFSFNQADSSITAGQEFGKKIAVKL